MIIEHGFLPMLFNILSSETYSMAFKKEILWTLSNLTIGEVHQIRAVFQKVEWFNILMQLCRSTNSNIRKEAIWVICNATQNGGREEITSLVDNGVLNMLSFNLDLSSETDVIKTILEALDNILNLDEDQWNRQGFHPMQDQLESSGILERLEKLLEHPKLEIYKNTLTLIDNYFDVQQVI